MPCDVGERCEDRGAEKAHASLTSIAGLNKSVHMPALTARQIRLGLVGNDFALTQVAATIDAMPEGVEKETRGSSGNTRPRSTARIR